ncbi:MAG TPA: hypothetical protein DCG54_09715 [Anaerolineae bacterium]|jgi:hypothetical protein|nr:hypothetical protein [Anaerolineae bacterium]
MANPKSKDEKPKAESAAPARKSTKVPSGLVRVTKDGETIDISPRTLENHQQLGWILVDGSLPAAPVDAASESDSDDEPSEETPE